MQPTDDTARADPFRHHPGLRGLITPPEESFFRTFDPANMIDLLPEGAISPPIYSNAEREAMRADFLAGLEPDTDLWVFGYASLMWDPGVQFSEVRRAHAPDHEIQFILKDTFGARGNAEVPGLMAALNHGHGSNGLVFRIPAALRDAESELIFRREMAGPAYQPAMIPIEHAAGQLEALAFLADPASDTIDPTLSHAQQVRFIATGQGFLGTSFEYLDKIHSQFQALKIDDPAINALFADVLAYRAEHGLDADA